MRKRFLLWLIAGLLFQAPALPAVFRVSKPAKASSQAAMNQPASQDHPHMADALSTLFIHVGKADTILFRCQDQACLIDTGEKVSVSHVLGALDLFGVDTLEGVFLTQTHSDLTGDRGMGAVLWHWPRTFPCPTGNCRAGNSVPLAEGVYAEVSGPLVLDAKDDNGNPLVSKLNAYGRSAVPRRRSGFYSQGLTSQRKC